VLAIGARLAARGDFDRADDVFLLTWQEIDDLLSGSAMFPHHVREQVRLRRRAHSEESAHHPPDVVSLPPGSYLPAEPKPDARARSSVLPGGADRACASGFPDTAAELSGVGACGGQARGQAAVLHDLAESARLTPGAVLVTRQTDPGWGPAFLLISGLVLERGGMLSHGAILAREYGIPSVVGVRDAVHLIQQGQVVVVDGDRGVVRLTDR
jgi:pyruvate,water dikinase